jgi:hypothetical protein
VLAVDRLQGRNLWGRKRACHLGEQVPGSLEQVSGRDRFGVRREIALGEAWILKLEATSGRALVVKIGSAKGCPKRDIHPEGAMVTIQSFVKFKVPTAGVE